MRSPHRVAALSILVWLAASLPARTEANPRAERAARAAEAADQSREPSEDAAAAAEAAAPVRPPAPPEKSVPWHHFVDQSTRPAADAASSPTTLRIINRELYVRLAVVAPTPCFTIDTDVRGKTMARELTIRMTLRDDGICLDQSAVIQTEVRIPALPSDIWQVRVERPECAEIHEARIP